MCFNETAPILAHINDESLLEGAFPDGIKIAKVVPIFENGEPKFVSNHRPRLSVLPTLTKICFYNAEASLEEGGAGGAVALPHPRKKKKRKKEKKERKKRKKK